jgi:hypothetical protein
MSAALPTATAPDDHVTYRRGEDGTHADLLLMPPAAYSLATEVLASTFNQIAQAMPGGAAAK